MKPGILFLDDEIHLLKSVKRYLHKFENQWNIYLSSSFDDAIIVLKTEAIDIAILDVNLPGKGGFDLLKYIKNDDNLKNIEIVMLTGLKDRKLKREALSFGASDLLQKPIQPEDLIARISSTLKVKQYQDELANKNKILQNELINSQKMEITGILAAGVIHDIRNIFSIIQNYPYIIESKLKKNLDVNKELKKIQIASQRAESILQQILFFAKHETMDEYKVDLNIIIKETIELLESVIPNSIKIIQNFSNKSICGIYNKQYIIQVIMNLLINAKEAIGSESGKIKITTSQITINNNPNINNGRYNKIEINDTGKGMDSDELKKIFATNYTSKTEGKNFGFGLSVIKILIQKLKGIIHVESEKGKGTSFIIYLLEGK